MMGLGAILVGHGFREARSYARHTGKAPVVPLAHARRGDVVHVVGTVTSPDAFASPTGGAPAAYLEVELKQVGSFGGTMRSFLSETNGNEVWMDDGSATGLIRMAHVDLRDRKPMKYVWYPRRQAPDEVVRMLAERGQRVPAVSQTAQNVPDLCYIERALRHGDPVRVHAVVLDVEEAEACGRPRVLSGMLPAS